MLNAVRNIGSFPKGVIFTLCAAIFWGSMAVAAQAVMANGVVNAGALVIVRLCSSGGLLLLWCCITARNEIVKIFTSWTNFRDVLFGAVFIYGGQFAFMLAIHYSNAGAAAIVLTTVPLWVALWEMIVNRSKPSPRMVICFLLAAVGVTLIVTKGEFDVSQFNLTGLTGLFRTASAAPQARGGDARDGKRHAFRRIDGGRRVFLFACDLRLLAL